MKSYTAVVEKEPDTGLFVGYVPGFAGAHSQGSLHLEGEFVGIQTIRVT